MIEREYVKLNTSIQTASNSTGLRTDADGNVEATIELKLPESLFLKKDGPKKIDSVRLQTSKMRVSMENTPIASIPLNTELSLASDVAVSTCQLGLYPYCILDNNTIEPYTLYPEGKLSLPYYSAHFVKFNFYYCFYNDTVISSRSDGHNTPEFQISLGNLIYTVDQMNYKTVIFGNSNFESALSKLKLDYSGLERYFNLTNTVNQDKVELSVTGDRLYIYQIGTLQQMLEDALETAFVSTSNPSLIQCDLYFVDRRTLSYVPDPLPNTEIMLVAPDVINDGDVLACFWKAEWHTTEITNMLKAGVKPQVRINSDSLSISYDTAPFNTVPVLWNPSFIENYEVPYSLKLNYGNEGSLYIPDRKSVV